VTDNSFLCLQCSCITFISDTNPTLADEVACFAEAMVAQVADGPEREQTAESQAKQADYDIRVVGKDRKAVL
jgi:hypothetical protein